MMMGGGWLIGLIVLVLILLLVGGGIAAVVWFSYYQFVFSALMLIFCISACTNFLYVKALENQLKDKKTSHTAFFLIFYIAPNIGFLAIIFITARNKKLCAILSSSCYHWTKSGEIWIYYAC